jgi:hypothetical protein
MGIIRGLAVGRDRFNTIYHLGQVVCPPTGDTLFLKHSSLPIVSDEAAEAAAHASRSIIDASRRSVDSHVTVNNAILEQHRLERSMTSAFHKPFVQVNV